MSFGAAGPMFDFEGQLNPQASVPLGVHWLFDTSLGEMGLAFEARYSYSKFMLGEDGEGPGESDRLNRDHDVTGVFGLFLRL